MLSVIIPTRDTNKNFPKLLGQLSDADIELIVSDGFSHDDTVKIAAAAKAKLAMGSASRGGQLRRGTFLANSDWLLFLHADSILADNWRYVVQQHIDHYPGSAGYFTLKYDSSALSARWVELMAAWRSWSFIWGWAMPYGDQGLLISRQLYDEIGGYPDWPIFEDVRIVENIGIKRLRPLGAKITSCAAKYEQDGFLKRGWRNFKLLRRYKRGDSIENLMRDYT